MNGPPPPLHPVVKLVERNQFRTRRALCALRVALAPQLLGLVFEELQRVRTVGVLLGRETVAQLRRLEPLLLEPPPHRRGGGLLCPPPAARRRRSAALAFCMRATAASTSYAGNTCVKSDSDRFSFVRANSKKRAKSPREIASAATLSSVSMWIARISTLFRDKARNSSLIATIIAGSFAHPLLIVKTEAMLSQVVIIRFRAHFGPQ